MGVHTIFGIKGVGKYTVAESLREYRRELSVTSVSRMSMYLLGIISDYDVHTQVDEFAYGKLEATPQDRMIRLESSEYREKLEELSGSSQPTVVLNHLVVAMRHLGQVEYLTNRQTPDWYIDINRSLLQLVAPPELIVGRRQSDKSRLRVADIDQITEHQELCDLEWQRIADSGGNLGGKMKIIPNIDLNSAVKDVEDVIFTRQ
jgi:adenylate kinase